MASNRTSVECQPAQTVGKLPYLRSSKMFYLPYLLKSSRVQAKFYPLEPLSASFRKPRDPNTPLLHRSIFPLSIFSS